jgi:hypothetical protein
MVSAFGGSTDMAVKKVTGQKNFQMEQSTIVCTSQIVAMVTEFKQTMMEKYIKESSKITFVMVMDS